MGMSATTDVAGLQCSCVVSSPKDMFLYIFKGAEHAGGVSFWIGVEQVGEKTMTCRSLMFPSGPVNKTVATPKNVATSFPKQLEWCLYHRSYCDLKFPIQCQTPNPSSRKCLGALSGHLKSIDTYKKD